MFFGGVVAEIDFLGAGLGAVLGVGDGLEDVGVMILGASAGHAGVTGVVSGDDGGFLFPGGDAGTVSSVAGDLDEASLFFPFG